MYTFNSYSHQDIKYNVLNFIAVNLQLYKIFKITRVSFFGTQCSFKK